MEEIALVSLEYINHLFIGNRYYTLVNTRPVDSARASRLSRRRIAFFFFYFNAKKDSTRWLNFQLHSEFVSQ